MSSAIYVHRFDPPMPYNGVTKVINVPEDYEGGIRQNVVLAEALPETIYAGEDSKVEIKLLQPGDVVMEFPKGSFLNTNYEPEEGEVTVWITTYRTDHSDVTDMIPGDFTTMVNNTAQALLSEGIFTMRFSGSGKPSVFLKESCKFKVHQPALANIGTPILWGMNDDTGLWEFNTNLELRQDEWFEGMVRLNPNVRTFNIDYRLDRCYAKVRTYQNAQFNEHDQLDGIQIHVVMTMAQSSRWSYINTATTNLDGVCLPVACCKTERCQNVQLYGRISAVLQNLTAMYPADPDLGQVTGLSNSLLASLEYDAIDDTVTSRYISSRIMEAADGPTYSTLSHCQVSNGYHYRFYLDHFERKEEPVVPTRNPATPEPKGPPTTTVASEPPS